MIQTDDWPALRCYWPCRCLANCWRSPSHAPPRPCHCCAVFMCIHTCATRPPKSNISYAKSEASASLPPAAGKIRLADFVFHGGATVLQTAAQMRTRLDRMPPVAGQVFFGFGPGDLGHAKLKPPKAGRSMGNQTRPLCKRTTVCWQQTTVEKFSRALAHGLTQPRRPMEGFRGHCRVLVGNLLALEV